MNFTQPLFLWTLAGAFIPIAIHLLSRKEGKVVKVGSLRHMEESNTSRFKSIRLNETLLLLARCLMITWLAFFLSGATCSSLTTSLKRWIVIEPGVERQPEISGLVDSLTASGAELHFLADRFPTSIPSGVLGPPDYWNLAQMLGKKTDHDIVVVAHNRLNGFRQNRPSLPLNIRWIVGNPNEHDFIITATKTSKDSAIVRTGHSNTNSTSFESEARIIASEKDWVTFNNSADSARVNLPDSITVTIVSEDKYKRDSQVLRAALRAMKTIPVLVVTEVNSTDSDWTFWLRDEQPPRPLRSKTILLRPSGDNLWLINEGRLEWHLTRRLTAAEALKDHFMISLAKTLLPQPPVKLNSEDVRSLPESMTWSKTFTANIGTNGTGRDMTLILLVLFVVTWIGERALALRRNL